MVSGMSTYNCRSTKQIRMMAPFFNKLSFFKKLIADSDQKTAHGKLSKDILECYGAMGYEFHQKGTAVFNYHDSGDKFYVIIKGKIEVLGINSYLIF